MTATLPIPRACPRDLTPLRPARAEDADGLRAVWYCPSPTCTYLEHAAPEPPVAPLDDVFRWTDEQVVRAIDDAEMALTATQAAILGTPAGSLLRERDVALYCRLARHLGFLEAEWARRQRGSV